ncbi:YlbG family protein [Marinicrinis lubricantis]|uniref:YlbG family protein n=1 Tax=Marinicrinis lubricantis TaxID=2086470 RepID=A0ABW1IMP6_9BACL
MFRDRTGLIVWVNDLRSTRPLERLGSVHYASKRMNYAVMYVNAEQQDQVIQQLQKLPFVKKVELSLRKNIKTDYNSKHADKTSFYGL